MPSFETWKVEASSVWQAEILRQQSEARDKRHELSKVESQARSRQSVLAVAEAEEARVASLLADAETLHDLAQAIEGQRQRKSACGFTASFDCQARVCRGNRVRAPDAASPTKCGAYNRTASYSSDAEHELDAGQAGRSAGTPS